MAEWCRNDILTVKENIERALEVEHKQPIITVALIGSQALINHLLDWNDQEPEFDEEMER